MKKLKEVYNNTKKKDCPNKKFINKILTRMVCKLADTGKIKRTKIKCVVLDGEDFGTSKALLKRDLAPKNIHVPNPFLYDILKKKKLVQTHNLLFNEFIITHKQKYHFIYPDYCCTANGNENVKPFVDFKKCFELKMFEDVALFATTLASRKNTKALYTGEDFNKVLSEVNNYASNNGYISKLLWNFKYQGMYHMVFGVAIPRRYKELKNLNPFD